MVGTESVGVSLPSAPQNPAYYFTNITGPSTDVIYTWELPEDDGCTETGNDGIIGYSIIHGTDLNNLITGTVSQYELMFQPTYSLNIGSSSYFKVAAITTYSNDIKPEMGGRYTDTRKVTFMTYTESVKVRGIATNEGYMDFYFTARTGDGTYVQLKNAFWRLTDHKTPISANANITNIKDLIDEESANPGTNVFKNGIVFAGDGYSPGWPLSSRSEPDKGPIDSISVVETEDIFGEGIKIVFVMGPYTDTSQANVENRNEYNWDVHASMTAPTNSSTGLDGMGAFLVVTDYTTDVSFYKEGSTAVRNIDFTSSVIGYIGSLIWTINSSIVYNPYLSKNENTPLTSKEFFIPIHSGDDLTDIETIVSNGGAGVDSLEDQINAYFLGSDIDPVIKSIYWDTDPIRPFVVVAETILPDHSPDNKAHMRVNIQTTVEGIQNQITCRTSNLKPFYLATRANTCYINDMMYELRSFEDMYGRNKPGSSTVQTGQYVKRSYGFKFNLDYIKEYQEDENASIDITPIPGMSSSNTIGLDIMGTTRVISITGVRVDNSNYWMFHAPFEYIDDISTSPTYRQQMQGGVIYMGTSNWGWCKFMKAIMGTFQFIDGPYRLIIMSIPSSLMQQYVPDRYCKYQYPDGTYIVQVGLEDMCYVLIERFTTKKNDEMFNATDYELVLRRVVALGSST